MSDDVLGGPNAREAGEVGELSLFTGLVERQVLAAEAMAQIETPGGRGSRETLLVRQACLRQSCVR